ncbi:sodium/proline symporter PutP [Propioniciclava coleopterorum]|uniref:Sodium/proline symporter n=1 Tax=Propioniciclava coleopterorum TaxID=2714937 RepID=A0A6G7Y7I0_9ACTN|nr:sodium/proline symporter PutP [Propioniciclava coleopterorum]QIK72772.1 sodium/proline symporter PutP [Propioniciclava coleopterorum]
MNDQFWQIVSMAIYLVAMVVIGFMAHKRTTDFGDYMLGGRSLGPFVSALSAGAADMSGWLLMGLPGALYVSGLVEGWIAIGLLVGAWANWKFVAPRLRAYTQVSGDSITIPSFLGSRLKDDSNLLRLISGAIILIFFTLYVSSGMVAGGTFFETSFGMNYFVGMGLVAVVTVLYTLVGGFLAVSWTDVVQGMMMVVALVILPIVGIIHLGGPGAMVEAINAVDPKLLTWFEGGTPIGIISAIAWGLGYVGMPHVLVRFMALTSPAEAKAGRRIGIGWMLTATLGATLTAFVGIAIFRHDQAALPDPEGVFIALGQLLFHPLAAGFLLAAILAAIMSTVSSQLLVTSSALVEDIYRAFSTKPLTPSGGVWLGRIGVLIVAVVAAALAAQRNDTILGLVAFAWAGFGAGFGPTIVLSLYWRRLTAAGAAAGMVVGAVTVFVWKLVLNPLGGVFELYEILPAFALNLLVAVAVSLATHRPNPAVEREFDEALEIEHAG